MASGNPFAGEWKRFFLIYVLEFASDSLFLV